jgi:hypothetical protein
MDLCIDLARLAIDATMAPDNIISLRTSMVTRPTL